MGYFQVEVLGGNARNSHFPGQTFAKTPLQDLLFTDREGTQSKHAGEAVIDAVQV